MRITVWGTAILVLAACGRSDRPRATSAASTVAVRRPAAPAVAPGLDPIVLRVARTGGLIRAYSYTILDSALWTSEDKAPRITRVLGFDDQAGSLAVIDAAGALRRVDIRTGHVMAPVGGKLAALTSIDGAAVYGVTPAGGVTRLTRSDAAPWARSLSHPARNVAPQTDGSLLVVGDAGDRTIVWRLRPPDSRILDSVVLPHVDRLIRPQVGDRLYCIIGARIEAVHIPDMALVPVVEFNRHIHVAVPTPSGDRLYVALDSTPGIRIVDRYTSRVRGQIDLPGAPADLRMDPLGRYLLARSADDTVWVIAIGSDHVVGTVRTSWTTDLPFVGPDGRVALADGSDVVFVDADSLRPRRTVPGGARNVWIPIRWNGFRPRPRGLDEPVSFSRIVPDSSDSIQMAIRSDMSDSTQRPVPVDSIETLVHAGPSPHGADTTHPLTGDVVGFVVQFAANLSVENARSIAATIDARGSRPHVVATARGGITVYRVVLGPYPTRAQADSVGQAAHRMYWVYEGTP